MNLSISLLSVNNYYNTSPFLSLSKYKSNKLNKIKASRFFNNFLFTSKSAFFHIENSYFNHFLKPVIITKSITHQNIYENEHIMHKRLIDFTEKTIFRRCSFSDLSTYEDGGFITTDYKIEVYDCSFLNAISKIGACIHSTNDVFFWHSSTEKCTAHEKGASIFQTSKFCSIKIEYSSFHSNEAHFSSVLHNMGIGKTIFQSLNLSKNIAKNCVACAEITDIHTLIEYSQFISCTAYAHDGALLIKGANSAAVNRCIFVKCAHNSQTYNAAAAVCFLDCPVESKVIESIFIHCKHSASFVVSPGWNGGLHIAYCNFSNSRQNSIYKNGITVIYNCLFKQKNDNYNVFLKNEPNFVTYSSNISHISNQNNLLYILILSLLLTLCFHILQKKILHIYRIRNMKL